MNETLDRNKILLGISGGVDSTTAALLLEKEGYEVSGMYFDITGCNAKGRKEAEEALRAAGARGQFIYVDAKKEFEEIVIRSFVSEYASGRTPNPCVICNPNIKFRYLTEKADEIGAYYIATGHYSDVIKHSDGNFYIKAIDSPKDQSYMLCGLSQDVLKRLILPLSRFTDKNAVRKLAGEAKLPSAEAKDSQEICFIDDKTGYAEYIRQYCEQTEDAKLRKMIEKSLKPGNFVDNDFNVLGRHKGMINYTVGQRKGLGIALGRPIFVTQLLGERNEVVLGESEELFNAYVSAGQLFFTGRVPKEGEKLSAKIRYAAKKSECTIVKIDENSVTVKFETPQRAATPGQQLVIYDGDFVLGGGAIN